MNIYGYFNDQSRVPAYDPGLDAECPICHCKLEKPVMTISFAVPGDTRSYFYRVHKACRDALSPSQRIQVEGQIEGVILDAIYKAREAN